MNGGNECASPFARITLQLFRHGNLA